LSDESACIILEAYFADFAAAERVPSDPTVLADAVDAESKAASAAADATRRAAASALADAEIQNGRSLPTQPPPLPPPSPSSLPPPWEQDQHELRVSDGVEGGGSRDVIEEGRSRYEVEVGVGERPGVERGAAARFKAARDDARPPTPMRPLPTAPLPPPASSAKFSRKKKAFTESVGLCGRVCVCAFSLRALPREVAISISCSVFYVGGLREVAWAMVSL
jgi:hypothetical protein